MAEALRAAEAGLEVEVVPVRTGGDEGAPKGGGEPGDKSRFVKEIEEALLAGSADVAVHSAKDVPGELPDGLALVGVPARADPRDALCGASALSELAEGALVGTGSLRRRSQLLAARPDLRVEDVRGNVDTRLRRLAEGAYGALVLAQAGLERLGRAGEGSPIPEAELTPAPGQGCLALEARADHERARELAVAITDQDALVELTAERAVVAGLDASCRTPIGARAELHDGALRLNAFAGLPDGSHWIRDALDADSSAPADAGRVVAERMITAGAAELLAEAERAADV